MKKNPINEVQKDIQIIIGEAIARLIDTPLKSINFETSFLELGIDSIRGVDLVETLNKEFSIDMGPEVIFDTRGPTELAQFIFETYRSQFQDSSQACNDVAEDSATHNSVAIKTTDDTEIMPGSEDIAIIGISGRFAESDNAEEYWDHLEKGHCCIKEIRREGWEEAAYYDPNPKKTNKSISKWGGFLRNIDKFDPLYFNLSPREAQRMDPQQRLFLEESIKAFEDSGYSIESLSNKKVGVFVGGRGMDYHQQAMIKQGIDSQFFLGNDMAILSGRISYHLNLKGPNITIDAACSSALAALHLACESIQRNESEMALAGAVFLIPSPQFYIMASKAEMLSPQGKCRTLNDDADGMVVGEGVGALVIKSLKKAIKDNDHIYGVIKAFGMNHNGRTQGITAPSSIPQKELITQVLQKSNINPEMISYTEIQGTGSILGDPIEFKALTEAFRTFTNKRQFCIIGSHTPNIGHTMNAAGMAALIKILKAMKHETLPPLIGLEKINKNINLQKSPFYTNSAPKPWKKFNNHPRYAGFGTFAFNGTNCYFIIQEAPKSKIPETEMKHGAPKESLHLIPLSAKTKNSLEQKLTDLLTWIEKTEKDPIQNFTISNIAYTLQIGRSHLSVRCAFIVKDLQDLKQQLKEKVNNDIKTFAEANFFENQNKSKGKLNFSQNHLFKEVARKLIEEMQDIGALSKDSQLEKLSALADLYISGHHLDWESLNKKKEKTFYRLPMPTYPFTQERYWLGGEYRYHQNLFESVNEKPEIEDREKTNSSILDKAINIKKQPLMDKEIRKNIEKGLEELHILAKHLLINIFQRMGVFLKGDEQYHNEELKKYLKIIPLYHRLLEALLKILHRSGIIQITDIHADGDYNIITTSRLNDITILKELRPENLENNFNYLIQNYPEIRPYTRLLWTTQQHYPKILNGEIPATDVMFPHYSMELMEGIYRGNYTADYYNQLTGWALISYIRIQLPKLAPGDKIKILEIGAGTGGTSSLLFDLIKDYADRLIFFYTDISAGFTRYGKKKYEAANPFVIFKVLDIEKDIVEQGFIPDEMDIVIATNILHATCSISRTLANVRKLLKPNGWLIANELSGVLDIYTINFGLLEGWWLYEDKSNRLPDSPLLDSKTWQKLLFKAGFRQVSLLSDSNTNEKSIRQHVIIGENYESIQRSFNNLPISSLKPINTPKPVFSKKKSNYDHKYEEKELYKKVEESILKILAEILEIDKIQLDPEKTHTDYGVDSILAIEIIDRINEELKIRLNSTDLFNYPTIKKLSSYILETFGNLNMPSDESNINQKKIEEKILGILAAIFHIEQKNLEMETPLTDLNLDTITADRVVKTLNEEFKVSLTVSDLINYSDIKQLSINIINKRFEKFGKSNQEIDVNLLIPTDTHEKIKKFDEQEIQKISSHWSEVEEVSKKSMDIAVIGMAARYPEAKNIDEFWLNISSGKNSIREVTRWELETFFHPGPQTTGKCNCKWGGFLEDIDTFDPLFFNISPKEAELMDPQHRLFLEESWKALEDAGYSNKELEESKCGVFVGFNLSDYQKILEKNGLLSEAYTFTGNHEAILSARLSYFLNLKGPGITINTACSTSLVAVHLACKSILNGDSDIAIAGGVQLMTTPELYIMTGRAGMLSPEGKCKTFDNDADGFVPSEGVGVVVLKPLKNAIQDGDQIYGTIIGSGINQDGKTNSITAPSSPSQTQLEREIYEKYNIDPSEITYVEAHGTGTRLGDPIEIEALTAAYKEYTTKKQFCAIGSVKTNIGHTGAAAGIAGLIKTLLSLKNKQITPSLHFQKENKYINFKESPFYVNTELKAWECYPGHTRIAAVSSFGFSGTNAHLVVKEIKNEKPKSSENKKPWYMIPLSAKSETSINNQIKQMISWLKTNGKYHTIQELSYMLLVCRSHFSHRSVLLVKSTENLFNLEKNLRIILPENKTDKMNGELPENYLSSIQGNPQFNPSPALEQFAEQLIQEMQNYHPEKQTTEQYRKKLLALADLYTQGYNLEWKKLFEYETSQRISLPTYPFDKKKYWISEIQNNHIHYKSDTFNKRIHKLIDRIDLEHSLSHGLVFQKTFKISDNILQDHQVQGHTILPGVGHMEMAIAAVIHLKENKSNLFNKLTLRKLTWLQSLEIQAQENKKDIFIFIDKMDGNGNCYTFEIKEKQTSPYPYSQGEIDIDSTSITRNSKQQILSIESIKKRCPHHLEANDFYNRFKEVGIAYGPYFKGVVQAWGNDREALGELRLPAQYENEPNQYILHPCIADGALQTIMAISHHQNSMRTQTTVPFTVEEVEILHPLPHKQPIYSYVKTAGTNRYNVAVLNDKGNVCIKLHELTVRESKKTQIVNNTNKLSFFTPQWKAQPSNYINKQQNHPVLIIYPSLPSATPDHPVGQMVNLFKKAIHKIHSNDEVMEVQFKSSDITLIEKFFSRHSSDEIPLIYFLGGLGVEGYFPFHRFNLQLLETSQKNGVHALFRLVKILNRLGYNNNPLKLKVITGDVHRLHPVRSDSNRLQNPYAASLHGMVRSMAKEFPSWEIDCIDISLEELRSCTPEDWEQLARQVMEEPGNNGGSVVIIRRGKRYVRYLAPVIYPPLQQDSDINHPPFKSKGVYCILGGTGGIGLELGLFLSEKFQARLVLLDRKSKEQLTPQQKEKIELIESYGGEVLLIPTDITDIKSMQGAIKKINQHFGKINGVFHSAIVLQDRLLENMDEKSFSAVLAPKIQGSMVLSKVMQEQKPDFIMFFSSAQSFLGNAGQANYSAACAFKDAFAHYLCQEMPGLVRIVNWGYWGSVGIVATEEYKHRLAELGMHSIQPEEGMKAIRHILSNKFEQILAINAESPLLEKMGVEKNRTQKRYSSQLSPLVNETVKELEDNQKKLTTNASTGFQQTYPEIGIFGQNLLLYAFREMGVFLKGGEQYNKNKLKEKLEIIPTYNRLFYALLEILENAGFISLCHQRIETEKTLNNTQLIAQISNDALEQEKTRLLKKQPELKSHINLLWECLSQYPQLLTGRKNHMEVMFPKGSRALVEGIYKNNPTIDFYNQLVASVVALYIEKRLKENPHEKLQIIEVGAGTGGTSVFVLEAIKHLKDHVNYYYTDISAGFTRFGKDKYQSSYPFTQFQVLDIEKEIKAQGFNPASFDLLLGSNVLHATRCMENTMENCKQLLKRNGILIINELTQPWDFATLTFGLTEGWWLYEDVEIRQKNSPLLGTENWEELLINKGFKKVHLLGNPGTEPLQMEQAVLVAESDGWVTATKESTWSKTSIAKSIQQNPAISAPPKKKNKIESSLTMESQKEKVIDFIKKIFCKVLKIEETGMNPRATFENFGIDSLVTLDINKELSKTFKNLSTTLLFEYTTIETLADFFIHNYQQELEFIMENSDESETIIDTDNIFRNHKEVQPSSDDIYKNDLTIKNGKKEINKTDMSLKSVFQNVKREKFDIAIVGIAGKYPQAPTLEDYWENLIEGCDCITETPADRWQWEEGIKVPPGIRWGGFLQDVDKFEPLFFNISPTEAKQMDPQERLFLEIVWELFEDAGITRKALEEMERDGQKVGVFVGVMNRDYEWCGGYSPYSSIANRISYFFNLKGPSIAIDTSCSGSLTAIHLANQSIQRGECCAAVAGGINLILHPGHYDVLSEKNMLSREGRCKSFSQEADGFIVGEGIGAILMKPLSHAEKSGDHIYAKIKGSAINAGGKTGGYMVPNPNAQSQLVTDTLIQANIHPRTITYIEAQATGSTLGDPIEITGLTKAFAPYTKDKQFCAIGSVKSNIGHLESASGIAGLTKVLLQMKYKQLVPSLHADTLNTGIPFKDTPFYVQRHLEEWKQPIIVEKDEDKQYPRRAGVSSFGAGGANAHIILEEYQEIFPSLDSTAYHPDSFIIILSARNECQLISYVEKLTTYLKRQLKNSEIQQNPFWLANLAYTLQEGREHMKERLAIVTSDIDQLIIKFEQLLQAEETSTIEEFYRGQVAIDQTTQKIQFPESFDKKELARRWVSGTEIPWEKLYPEPLLKKISLPTYPFEKKRYWVTDIEQNQNPKIDSISIVSQSLNQKEKKKSIEENIIEILSMVLGIPVEEFEIEAAFTDFGVDSVFAVDIINRLNDRMELYLRTTDLFNYPTINQLTLHILDELNPKIESEDNHYHKNLKTETEEILDIFNKLHQGELTTDDVSNLLEM